MKGFAFAEAQRSRTSDARPAAGPTTAPARPEPHGGGGNTTAKHAIHHERHTWWVLGVGAAVGFCVGAFVYPMWTDNVESAQVIANLVEYRQRNVMHVYHTSVYTILIQLAAVLLRLGASEWTLCVLFSGLQAALACSALALFTLAVSRSAVTALAVPVLLLRFREALPDWPTVYLAVYHGHRYPNLFPNHASIYGVFGLFWILLVFSLFGLRKVRTASVLLGLMPAVHPGLALPCLFGTLTAAAFLRRQLRPRWKVVLRYGSVGLAVFAVTVLLQVALRWDVPTNIPWEEVDRVAEAFARAWDDHNTLLERGDWIGFFESEYYTIALAISLLTYLRRFLPEAARVILVALLGITVLAVGYSILVNVSTDLVSWRLRGLMIRRWLNLSSFAFPVMALGVLGQLAFVRRDALAALAMAIAGILVFGGYALSITAASSQALAGDEPPQNPLRGLAFPLTIVLSACVLGCLSERKRSLSYPERFAPVLVAVTLMALTQSLYLHHFSRIEAPRLRGVDGFTEGLSKAAQRKGLLLVSDNIWDVGRVQLRTRRPLLLDITQLNMLLKVPRAGPRMAYILKRVYGVEDLEDGSPELLDQHWVEYSLERWQEIRREFEVTDVLARTDLSLQLPKVFEDDNLILYTIPPPSQ